MNTLTETQLVSMLEMQDGMNKKVNPDWVAANNNWHRAIQVEAVEAIEHHGWKWWKKQNCEMVQLRMELVDIWHFILSTVIQNTRGSIRFATIEMISELSQKSVQFDNQHYILAKMSLLEKLDLLVGLSAAKRTSLALFNSLLSDCGMSWVELFKQYTGKNVLNVFRQDYGYKAGTYIKIWNGREDNEHLVELLNIIDLSADNVHDQLYQTLKSRYMLVLDE
ncbi:MAG: dUTP diphosphatase [Nitrosomonadaceae bacterium]|nr:dUTP diphosphatase [Nitrosospira sp.]MBI0408578.1 dUTP diphosphatase [Nitrosospira sp.]MBI0410172.1 dUTP diphosphatase [Nitrosospira sp.]MBI0411938.1 dUTP diphosphatase [Nitrosospira sp.]MDW7618432.1 dUTP diphosphatase [Nitrosomonadaceae bacterium]